MISLNQMMGLVMAGDVNTYGNTVSYNATLLHSEGGIGTGFSSSNTNAYLAVSSSGLVEMIGNSYYYSTDRLAMNTTPVNHGAGATNSTRAVVFGGGAYTGRLMISVGTAGWRYTDNPFTASPSFITGTVPTITGIRSIQIRSNEYYGIGLTGSPTNTYKFQSMEGPFLSATALIANYNPYEFTFVDNFIVLAGDAVDGRYYDYNTLVVNTWVMNKPTGTNNIVYGMAYSPELTTLVAGTAAGDIYYSVGGPSVPATKIPPTPFLTGYRIRRILWNSFRQEFILVAGQTNMGVIAKSNDGINWERLLVTGLDDTTMHYKDIFYYEPDNSYFICGIASAGNNFVAKF